MGQGTNEGAIVSSINLDGGINEHFEDDEDEIDYSGLKIKPCLFQDDVARIANNLKSVQKGNEKMESLAESKLLDYNFEKSTMILLGSRKFQNKIKSELKDNLIMFCGKVMTLREINPRELHNNEENPHVSSSNASTK